MRDRVKDVYNARSRAIKSRRILDEAKLRRGCAVCSYNEHAVALDFNHYKGAKRADITKMVTYSWASIIEELRKCVVLCSNCHRVVTHTTKDGRWK